MIPVSVEFVGAVALNALIVGISWGALRGQVTATRQDVCAIRKALGLEPVNGRIESAFVPSETCHLRQQMLTEKLDRIGTELTGRLDGLAESLRDLSLEIHANGEQDR